MYRIEYPAVLWLYSINTRGRFHIIDTNMVCVPNLFIRVFYLFVSSTINTVANSSSPKFNQTASFMREYCWNIAQNFGLKRQQNNQCFVGKYCLISNMNSLIKIYVKNIGIPAGDDNSGGRGNI